MEETFPLQLTRDEYFNVNYSHQELDGVSRKANRSFKQKEYKIFSTQ